MTPRQWTIEARHHRERGGSWEQFWSRNAAAIKDDFPAAGERKRLVESLMEIVLQGGSGRPCEPKKYGGSQDG
ncbi:MAG: hypothetical protein ACE15C_20085 [Phycisphaerae bacterium]